MSPALEPLLARAAQGNAAAQYTLLELYVSGHGVPKDRTKALEWLEQAAAQGHVNAQFHIGWLHGTIEDYGIDAIYLEQKGYSRACIPDEVIK